MTAEIFVTILEDLDNHLERNEIKRPVILFIDGASPHISMEMARFCRLKQIQPWLFKPNTTHIAQPLDLSFNKSMKSRLRVLVHIWQQKHVGESMTRYSVVPQIREATEGILATNLSVLKNGFVKAGLYPWNPAAVDLRRLAPSKVFAKDTG